MTLWSFIVGAILMVFHFLFQAIRGAGGSNVEVQGFNLTKLANYSITVGPILDIYIKSQRLNPTMANILMILLISLVIYITYKHLSSKEILIKDREINDVIAKIESTLKHYKHPYIKIEKWHHVISLKDIKTQIILKEQGLNNDRILVKFRRCYQLPYSEEMITHFIEQVKEEKKTKIHPRVKNYLIAVVFIFISIGLYVMLGHLTKIMKL